MLPPRRLACHERADGPLRRERADARGAGALRDGPRDAPPGRGAFPLRRSASTKPPREGLARLFAPRASRNPPPPRSARGTFCTRVRRLTSRPSPRRACARTRARRRARAAARRAGRAGGGVGRASAAARTLGRDDFCKRTTSARRSRVAPTPTDGEILNRLGLALLAPGAPARRGGARFERPRARRGAHPGGRRATPRDAARRPIFCRPRRRRRQRRSRPAARPRGARPHPDADRPTTARFRPGRAKFVGAWPGGFRGRAALARCLRAASAALAKLGVLRFKAAVRRRGARGPALRFSTAPGRRREQPASLTTFAPRTRVGARLVRHRRRLRRPASDALARVGVDAGRGERECVGSFRAVPQRARRRRGPVRRAIPMERPSFRDGFETAWGVLAGAAPRRWASAGVGAVRRVRPCVVANDATPRKDAPVLAELARRSFGSLGAAASRGRFSRNIHEYPEYPDRIQAIRETVRRASRASRRRSSASYGRVRASRSRVGTTETAARPSPSRWSAFSRDSWRRIVAGVEVLERRRVSHFRSASTTWTSTSRSLRSWTTSRTRRRPHRSDILRRESDEPRKRSTAVSRRRYAVAPPPASTQSSFLSTARRARGAGPLPEDPRLWRQHGRWGVGPEPDGPRRTHRFEPADVHEQKDACPTTCAVEDEDDDRREEERRSSEAAERIAA